jgi:hypothetical protein
LAREPSEGQKVTLRLFIGDNGFSQKVQQVNNPAGNPPAFRLENRIGHNPPSSDLPYRQDPSVYYDWDWPMLLSEFALVLALVSLLVTVIGWGKTNVN